MSGIFYVYEHWRPDLGKCFYVGKGCGRRACLLSPRSQRNFSYAKIVVLLREIGLVPEVRIVARGLSEQDAFALEIDLIKRHRSGGSPLVNMTEGGDGASGRKMSAASIARLKDRVFTDEHRRRISESKKGIPQSAGHKLALAPARKSYRPSPETIERIRIANIGKVVPEKTRRKISASKKGKSNVSAKGRKPWCKGKTLSAETRLKMSEARRGKRRGPMSLVQKRKIRQTLLGRSNVALKGKPLSAEHREKLVAAWVRRKAKMQIDGQNRRGTQGQVSDAPGSTDGARSS